MSSLKESHGVRCFLQSLEGSQRVDLRDQNLQPCRCFIILGHHNSPRKGATKTNYPLGDGFNDFLFSLLPGEMIQFDEHFSDGLVKNHQLSPFNFGRFLLGPPHVPPFILDWGSTGPPCATVFFFGLANMWIGKKVRKTWRLFVFGGRESSRNGHCKSLHTVFSVQVLGGMQTWCKNPDCLGRGHYIFPICRESNNANPW